MTTQNTESKAKAIKFGSPEDEAIVSAGYSMSRVEAEKIVKDYEANPAGMPYSRYEKAKAMIERLNTKPIPISKAPGHFRKKNRFTED